MTIFDEIYRQTNEFLEENASLKAGTGRYSSFFRGTIMGTGKGCEAEERLGGAGVDVLWLGSNPNISSSLAAVLTKSNDFSSYAEYVEQVDTGYFSEINLDTLQPTWDPVNPDNKVSWQWRYLGNLVCEKYDRNKILMANFVPWGSANFNEFLKQVSEYDPELLRSILAFCNHIHQFMIVSLKPKLVILPKSIAENSYLNRVLDTHVSMKCLSGRVERIDTSHRKLSISVADVVLAGHKYRAISTYHPSFPLLKAEREALFSALRSVL
ncbi:hypothetical protein [Terasakiella pusilla]|uniref:hypothetical protein n=1 Tax=Terasakiella pusilla TaxID=64973 RepID=UPI003AA7E284